VLLPASQVFGPDRGAALVGRPELVARRSPAGVDRVGVLDEVVDRRALGEVLADLVEAPGVLEALAQLLRRRALARR
jgi:hypothetical protein